MPWSLTYLLRSRMSTNRLSSRRVNSLESSRYDLRDMDFPLLAWRGVGKLFIEKWDINRPIGAEPCVRATQLTTPTICACTHLAAYNSSRLDWRMWAKGAFVRETVMTEVTYFLIMLILWLTGNLFTSYLSRRFQKGGAHRRRCKPNHGSCRLSLANISVGMHDIMVRPLPPGCRLTA